MKKVKFAWVIDHIEDEVYVTFYLNDDINCLIPKGNVSVLSEKYEEILRTAELGTFSCITRR